LSRGFASSVVRNAAFIQGSRFRGSPVLVSGAHRG
jgi:hypothetical protein